MSIQKSAIGRAQITNEIQLTFSIDGVNFEVPPYKFIYTDSDQPVTATEDVAEATAIAILPSAAHIRILDEKGQTRSTFRLDGEAWTAGRELRCGNHSQLMVLPTIWRRWR